MTRKKPESTTLPPLSDVHDRTSDVIFTEREAVSSSRARVRSGETGELPATLERDVESLRPLAFDVQSALDRLLTMSCELPIEEGDEAVVRAVVDELSSILPRCSVGVCFVPSDEQREQLVVRKTPMEDIPEGSADPSRLFAWHGSEVVVPLPGKRANGSTLHLASDEVGLMAEGGPVTFVARRAAGLLSRALAHAEAEALADRAGRSVRSLNAQMVQAEKLASLGQIAAGMVHELNNPLTSIVAYSDYLTKRWLAKGNAADSDELERLRRIGESAHRLLRFTRDLVTYARPSSETPMPIVLHGVIDQALVFCEHLLGETGTRVDRQFGDGVLPIRGLPEQLTQVFVNLITNACHAMPQGGVLTISTELVDADGAVRVLVGDTGHGISTHHQSKIFTPFFTTKTDGRGTGLGLAIVKSIIEGHAGEIRVESEPDAGTRFYLLLPVAPR